MMSGKQIAVVCIYLLFSGLNGSSISVIPILNISNQNIPNPQYSVNLDEIPSDITLIKHSPIDVAGNSELAAISTYGSGTESDPYTIQKLNITSYKTPITISSVTAFVQIRYCYLSGLNFAESSIFLNNSDNVKISLNQITESNNGILAENNSNILISTNSIYGNQKGIHFINVSSTTIFQNSVFSNEGDGVLIEESDFSATHNLVYNNSGSGFIVKSSNQTQVMSNEMNSNGIHGLALESSYRNVVLLNNITDNQNYGLYVLESNNNTINSNDIEGSDTGLYLDGNENVLIGNSMDRSEQTGLYVVGDYNEIGNSLFYRNQEGLIVASEASSNLITQNSMIRNNLQIMDDGESNTIDGNYYDDWRVAGSYSIPCTSGEPNVDENPRDRPMHHNPTTYVGRPHMVNPLPSIINETYLIVWLSSAHSDDYTPKYSLVMYNHIDEHLLLGNSSTTLYSLDTTEYRNGIYSLKIIIYQVDSFEYFIGSTSIDNDSPADLIIFILIGWIAAMVILLAIWYIKRRRSRQWEYYDEDPIEQA